LDGSRNPQSSLAASLLAYMAFLILIVTLFPFNFAWPSQFRIDWYLGFFDASTNVLMFMPLGFLFRLCFAGRWDLFLFQTLGAGALFSALIEGTQLFLINRETSLADVATNSLGALAGAIAQLVLSRTLSPRLKERFIFDLPVLAPVYLSSLLLWLNSEASKLDAARLWLSPILGAAGATILAAVWFYQLRPDGVLTRESVAVVVGVWYLGSSTLALRIDPNFVGACAAAVAALAYAELLIPGFFPTKARRFEPILLWMTTPLFLLYLMGLILWPYSEWSTQFRGMGGLPKFTETPTFAILGLLEWVTAFTLLGYLAAEWRGRRDESRAAFWTISSLAAVGGSSAAVVLRGFHPQHRASVVELAFGAFGALFGSVIYQRLLTTIRGRSSAGDARTIPLRSAPRRSLSSGRQE
jgi:VanZ family protein